MRNTIIALSLFAAVPLAGCEMIEDRNCDTNIIITDPNTGARTKVRDLVNAGLTAQVQAMIPMSESLRTFHAHKLLAIDNHIDRDALKRLDDQVSKLKCANSAAAKAAEQVDALASFVAFRGKDHDRYARPTDYLPFFDRALDAVDDYLLRAEPTNAQQTRLALKRIRDNLEPVRR